VSGRDVGSELGGTFAFYNDANTASTPDPMWLPRVASNLETRYESWIIVTVGNVKYV
jgi:hypothetical protein